MIASKLFFDFKKEYTELQASDVSEFIATKDYEQDLADYKDNIQVVNVEKDGKVDYTSLVIDGISVHNFRGNLEQAINETSETAIYQQYKNELTDYVFNKLANPTE